MGTQKRLLFRIGTYALAFGALVLFRTAVHYFVAEKDVQARNKTAWTPEFKSGVVNHCENSILSRRDADRSPASLERFHSYCECLADGIERAKLISPYFNPVRTKERTHLKSSADTVNRYLASPQGQTLTQNCAKGNTQ